MLMLFHYFARRYASAISMPPIFATLRYAILRQFRRAAGRRADFV
jgi:hypothetical protein